MHQERENLDILFRRTAPEIVLDNIRTYGQIFKECQLKADVSNYDKNTYEHYSLLNFQEYSPDEVELRFEYLNNSANQNSYALIFHTLYDYANKVLVMKHGEPVCKLDMLLGWNSISKRLSQDLLTTIWLAKMDADTYETRKRSFSWPPVIKTDDKRLEEIFAKGLAENHFHLHGSTQSFAISWIALMNHPEYLGEYFLKRQYLKENLNVNISRGNVDNQMSWKDRVKYAAMIRALLFARCADIIDGSAMWEMFRRFDRIPSVSKIKQQTESLRRIYGTCFEQRAGRNVYLDYTISGSFYHVDGGSANRLLAGERSLLYHCFRRLFEKDFTVQEATLLYLYILIKNQFRSELVQVNRRMGFTNFAWYQNRKNQFFGVEEEYWAEAQRLSIGSAMEDGHLVSLEARIMPKDTTNQLRQEINRLNFRIRLALGENKEMPYYVIHFPKKKFSYEEFKRYGLMYPRNWQTRVMVKKRAQALVKYLQTYDRAEESIWGIDACSLEIGCRPEVFATEFRYVRQYGGIKGDHCWNDDLDNKREKIGITYHVGEDFLDIIDGLRAIDEAISFLQLKNEDRLGHALALGIDPEEYYEKKKREIYIPSQDYLDNLIWILYRSLELNIQIDANYRAKMQEEARSLLLKIYRTDNSHFVDSVMERQPTEVLDMYYASWKLRGDHPDLYRSGSYKEIYGLAEEQYNSCMKTEGIDESYREHNLISELYSSYHFDDKAKKEGLKPICFSVERWYEDLAREFQVKMRQRVAEKGLAIECNPTSNVLIGTFGFYDRHPILAFNDHHLNEGSKEAHIQVSINTDDLGVFDTSLENEYALLLCAICRARHKEGNYNDDAVYEYLDYLRENGIRMSFRTIKEINQMRSISVCRVSGAGRSEGFASSGYGFRNAGDL